MQPEAAARSSGPDDMQASNGLEGWDSMDDMEDFQEASSQVDGVPPSLYLLAHPAVPINVPDTQVHLALLYAVPAAADLGDMFHQANNLTFQCNMSLLLCSDIESVSQVSVSSLKSVFQVSRLKSVFQVSNQCLKSQLYCFVLAF